MGDDLFRWDDVGPRGAARRVILVRPRPGCSVRAVLLCRSITGLWLHWHDGRSVPCLGEEEGCPLHDGCDNWGLRWKGFVGCITSRTFLPRGQVLEVTADAWSRCLVAQQLSEAGRLRGVEVEVVRCGTGPRGRCGLSVLYDGALVPYAAILPPEPDTRGLVTILFPRFVPVSMPKKEVTLEAPDSGE